MKNNIAKAKNVFINDLYNKNKKPLNENPSINANTK